MGPERARGGRVTVRPATAMRAVEPVTRVRLAVVSMGLVACGSRTDVLGAGVSRDGGSGWTRSSDAASVDDVSLDGDGAPDGRSCDSGGICVISGTELARGALNPSNPCQVCQPGTSTTAWSDLVDGTPCGSGSSCTAGACVCVPSSCAELNAECEAGWPSVGMYCCDTVTSTCFSAMSSVCPRPG